MSQVTIPQSLPFLQAICWQTKDVKQLSLEQMLSRYERGWHYRGVLGEPLPDELQFIQQLCSRYGSWLMSEFQLPIHQNIFTVLSELNRETLAQCQIYFGGGTLIALSHSEFRTSKDIDFLIRAGNSYNLLRERIYSDGYRALDASVQSRDLIDLAILRLDSPLPKEAIDKASEAYPVIEPLKNAIVYFQQHPDYRESCFQSLCVKSPERIIDGLDCLAAADREAPNPKNHCRTKLGLFTVSRRQGQTTS